MKKIIAGAFALILAVVIGCGHNTPPVVVDTGPVIDFPNLPPVVIPSLPPVVTPPAPDTTVAEDEAIINAVLANGESEETVKNAASVFDDRAVIFGDNFPGTNSELHECVNDARKNALNLVRLDGFDTKNIRLILNQRCTAANYKRWILWAIKDMKLGESRRFIANSSHGSQDVTPDGKTVGIICTWDQISLNDWSPEHEISFQWLYDNLRTTSGNFTMLLDQCYAGGSVRFSLAATNKRIRSIAPSAAAQARIDKAVESSGAAAKLVELTGFVNPACAANELSSEDSQNGGEGTEAFWRARRALGRHPLATDLVREENKFLRSIQATQHMQLVGFKGNLWGIKP